MTKFSTVAFALLLLTLAAWARRADAATPIFVLHSYSQEYQWTRGQHEGFLAALGADTTLAPVISAEYLDTKRRSYDPAYAQAVADHLRLKYADYRPAAIYVSDDNALLFARDYLRQIFPDAPVFFSGVNDYTMQQRLDPRYFTGVFEKKEVRPNLEWLLRFDPKLRDLVVVGDGSNTYAAIETEARKDLADFPQVHARFVGEKRLDVLLQFLRAQPAQYVLLTTVGGVTDGEGKVLPLSTTLRALSRDKRRVISMEDGYVQEGVMGGYVTRGPEQGAAAAHLMERYLQGTPMIQLAPVLKSPNAFLFDDSVLEMHGLEMPAEIGAQASLLNPRQRFVDQHRVAIMLALYALAILFFLVIVVMLWVVSRKNRQLSIAREAAETANLAKSKFLANMSHDIRTPLTSIIGYAELLHADPMAEDRRESTLSIIRNGHHLLELINNILDLAKVESGNIEAEKFPIDLASLLHELNTLVAGQGRTRLRKKSVAFEIDAQLPLPVGFNSDPVRLKQILVNFLGNAFKFTDSGTVTLHLSYVATPPTLSFAVADSGIGMTAEELARLFQPFVQADVSTTRRFGGSGLGLYLCRQLAGVLGGRVEAQSEPGRGSRFILHLPLEESPSKLVLHEDELRLDQYVDLPNAAVPSLSGRVLLAEDGRDNQRLISTYLRQAGLEVKVVSNGREAVEAALSEDFDVVLMDIQMPEMDGVTATETLRGIGYSRPIVALTANVMTSEVRHYREIGCDAVLSKPIERTRFFRVLSEMTRPGTTPVPILDEAYKRDIDAFAAEFRAHLPDQVSAIEAALAQADWPQLRTLAHVLKGSAGAFGFPGLTTLAGQLENSVIAGNHADAAVLCRALAYETQTALAAYA